MAFLKTLRTLPAVIITTAYHQYAVEGFDLNVTDYLLKPFEFERFFSAVNKVKPPQPENDKFSEHLPQKDCLFLNVQEKKVKVLFADIVYIESQREYIKLVTTKNEYVAKMSTHEIERLLTTSAFKRIHRSFNVALDKIESYTADTVEAHGVSLSIGRGYKDTLENL